MWRKTCCWQFDDHEAAQHTFFPFKVPYLRTAWADAPPPLSPTSLTPAALSSGMLLVCTNCWWSMKQMKSMFQSNLLQKVAATERKKPEGCFFLSFCCMHVRFECTVYLAKALTKKKKERHTHTHTHIHIHTHTHTHTHTHKNPLCLWCTHSKHLHANSA